jgi:hypothetical protein
MFKSRSRNLLSNRLLCNSSSFFSLQTQSSVFNKNLSHWTSTQLPILPRVAFAHKTIKNALLATETDIPEDFAKDLRKMLNAIRKVNWNCYNSYDNDFTAVQIVKKSLEELNDLEKNLPEPLANVVKETAAFESLRSAIDCLDERSKGSSHIYPVFRV